MLNQMKPKNITLFLFVVVAVIELITEIYNLRTLNVVVKPLLMPSLAVHFFFSVSKKNKLAFFVIIALMLSWFGDVFLMFQNTNPNYFVFGLVSFLLAHVTYIIIFSKSSSGFKPSIITYSTGFSLTLFGVLLLFLLWTSLGDMKLPVLVYTIVIISMGMTTLFRKAEAASIVLVGAILFIASDSMIAVNKFYEPIISARFWIMITYISAQYLITIGMINYFNKEK
jgi:uncharacterized membrane protein YhhN